MNLSETENRFITRLHLHYIFIYIKIFKFTLQQNFSRLPSILFLFPALNSSFLLPPSLHPPTSVTTLLPFSPHDSFPLTLSMIAVEIIKDVACAWSISWVKVKSFTLQPLIRPTNFLDPFPLRAANLIWRLHYCKMN